MFCPFTKENCVSTCVFNNNSCNLLKIMKDIESNTGSDQTESWYINSKLGDISDKLDRIIEILEQSAD